MNARYALKISVAIGQACRPMSWEITIALMVISVPLKLKRLLPQNVSKTLTVLKVCRPNVPQGPMAQQWVSLIQANAFNALQVTSAQTLIWIRLYALRGTTALAECQLAWLQGYVLLVRHAQQYALKGPNVLLEAQLPLCVRLALTRLRMGKIPAPTAQLVLTVAKVAQ